MTGHLYPLTVGCHRIHHGVIGVALVIAGVAMTLTDWREWVPDLIRFP